MVQEIELRNKAKEVIAKALISDEDYDMVSKYRWYQKLTTPNKPGYVETDTYSVINGVRTRKIMKLHQMIMHNLHGATHIVCFKFFVCIKFFFQYLPRYQQF